MMYYSQQIAFTFPGYKGLPMVCDVLPKKSVAISDEVFDYGIEQIAIAILRQTLLDAHDNNHVTRYEARAWLDNHGLHWADALDQDWLTPDLLRSFLTNRKPKKHSGFRKASRKESTGSYDFLGGI